MARKKVLKLAFIGGGGIGPICGRLIACYADYLFGQRAGP